MKRFVCLILILLIVLGCCTFSFAQSVNEDGLIDVSNINYTFNEVISPFDDFPYDSAASDGHTFYFFQRFSSADVLFGRIILEYYTNRYRLFYQIINSSNNIQVFENNNWVSQSYRYLTFEPNSFITPEQFNWFSKYGTFDFPTPPISVFDLVLSDISDVFDFGLDTLHTAISSITTTPILLIPCIMVFAYIGVRLFRILLY